MDAISSYKTFLMTSANGTTWTKLVDIKDFPDLGQEPENLDKTTLSEKARSYIPGIQDSENKTFTTNYNKTDYIALRALRGEEKMYAVWFGGTEAANGEVTPTGDDGKYIIKGYLDVYVNGTGVNEVVDMTITITPSAPIDDSETTA